MLVGLAILAASVIPVMAIGGGIANSISNWRWSIPIVQTIIGAIVGYVLFTFIPAFTAPMFVVIVVNPFVFNIGSVVYKSIQRKRALDGLYGEETQWAAELVEEGDQAFIIAVNSLPKVEMTEIGIIAESKEELRELTIERLDEMATEPLPEVFGE